MMKIDILTLFPEMFEAVLSAGVIGKARERGLLVFRLTDIRIIRRISTERQMIIRSEAARAS